MSADPSAPSAGLPIPTSQFRRLISPVPHHREQGFVEGNDAPAANIPTGNDAPAANIPSVDDVPAANPPSGNDASAANPSSGNDAPAANPPSGENEFPSILTCPICMVPPANGVRFDIEDSNHQMSPQVFEESSLFRYISTTGLIFMYRNVKHPLTSATVRRDRALMRVIKVSRETQERINRQRRHMGLSLEDPSPITQDDHNRYNETIRAVLDP